MKQTKGVVYWREGANSALCADTATVEAESYNGIGIHVVGMPDEQVKEMLLRVVTALQSKGIHIPSRKITIRIKLPRKHCNTLLLDMAVAYAMIAEAYDLEAPELCVGQLRLDGSTEMFSDYELQAIGQTLTKKGPIITHLK